MKELFQPVIMEVDGSKIELTSNELNEAVSKYLLTTIDQYLSVLFEDFSRSEYTYTVKIDYVRSTFRTNDVLNVALIEYTSELYFSTTLNASRNLIKSLSLDSFINRYHNPFNDDLVEIVNQRHYELMDKLIQSNFQNKILMISKYENDLKWKENGLVGTEIFDYFTAEDFKYLLKSTVSIAKSKLPAELKGNKVPINDVVKTMKNHFFINIVLNTLKGYCEKLEINIEELGIKWEKR